MNRKSAVGTLIGLALAAGAVLGGGGCRQDASNAGEKTPASVSFKPQEMADALHAVIAADREVYARHVVQRLDAEEKAIRAAEHWKQEKALPLPAQMLRLSSQAVQQNGAEFHYVLRSLWAINPKSKPETETERTGLQFVADHPDKNFYKEESLGGRRYFTAVYPDRAVVTSCVECHNQHRGSPRKDFKLGDVMGGVVVRVPLEF